MRALRASTLNAAVALALASPACSDGSPSWNASPVGGTHGSSSSGGHASDSGAGVTSGLPAISITTPQNGATVTVIKPDDTVEVWFSTSHFMLAKPGTCPASLASTDNCGHVHLLVDGAACSPDGSPDNDEGFVSPVIAILTECSVADGRHTLTMELHHDDHSPVLDRSHEIVSASVMVTASGG
jgi:hypothetical protein